METERKRILVKKQLKTCQTLRSASLKGRDRAIGTREGGKKGEIERRVESQEEPIKKIRKQKIALGLNKKLKNLEHSC